MRFLLDTDVLSEPTRPHPDAGVMQRLEAHRTEMATAAVVMHELQYGVARLPHGRRREQLGSYVTSLATSTLPVLPYDRRAAEWHATSRAAAAGAGQPTSFADGMITAIAAVNGLTLVTRNLADVAHLGIPTVSWWHSSP
ncbi:PIN domain-containing protein [soil metagenome]